jgi:hypothetical protein
VFLILYSREYDLLASDVAFEAIPMGYLTQQLAVMDDRCRIGHIPIALRVPMERMKTGRKNYGGEIDIELDSNIPTG